MSKDIRGRARRAPRYSSPPSSTPSPPLTNRNSSSPSSSPSPSPSWTMRRAELVVRRGVLEDFAFALTRTPVQGLKRGIRQHRHEGRPTVLKISE
ncbi:hypothetical protein D9611_010148 [Ephemerocybe angulata]|uniref:Uncharacterized protein n=1 Tax=Ephemerocybe angulata TaxID=980116 RepID=A0A8H5AZ16_9AGAR|nr:hypothetical protein D9611_010148 [Tulosesus angulatus]